MSEASSRVLIDRSIVRLDGRPFFSFGPRLMFTPQEKIPAAVAELADSGFTVIGSPPCSPGTVPLMEALFDAAEAHGLLVMLIPDPRLPEHGRYMADRFRHHTSLHSYVLPRRPADDQGYTGWIRDRDSIRAHDLFHPIFTQLEKEQYTSRWLRSQDIYCPVTSGETLRARLRPAPMGKIFRTLRRSAATVPSRPYFCLDLPVFTSDEERRSGVHSDDRWVADHSPTALDWFPYLANFANLPRRDFFGPFSELIRLQVFDLLSSGARGIVLDFYEGMCGHGAYTGRDRYYEAEILAQEIGIFQDFFAEGRPEALEIETGHPRLGSAVLRHGHDLLIVLRMEGYEEEFFIDEAFMERTEVSMILPDSEDVKVWRMDFPEAKPLDIMRDAAGSIRFLPGPLELTGLLMVTKGERRSQDIAREIRERLPRAARAAVEILAARFSKVALIEGELRQLDAGVNNRERLLVVQKSLEEARSLLQKEDPAGAYLKARQTTRLIRQIIKYQMARALATPVTGAADRNLFRTRYYSLPDFYREATSDAAKAFSDLT